MTTPDPEKLVSELVDLAEKLDTGLWPDNEGRVIHSRQDKGIAMLIRGLLLGSGYPDHEFREGSR